MMNLTLMDVKKLTMEPSARVRSMLAAKLVMDFRSRNFSETEADIAVDIFRILLKDTERKVRKTLSEHLSHCPHAPHDVIVKLASDEEDVAVHVLEHSQVLTDDDLIQLARATKEVLKLCAIARRSDVSESVSDVLLDTQQEQVLNSLFHNRGAKIREQAYMRNWHHIASRASLLETLVHRGNLPIAVAEKVYHLVTDEMKRHLNKSYQIGVPLAQKVASDTREWEMLGVIPAEGGIDSSDDEKVEGLIDQLFLGGRLTHSFLMRALCVGSLGVFEAGLAKLAGVPRVNARILLMDGGALGFGAIYKAAGMPEGFAGAVKMLLKISMDVSDFGRSKSAAFRKQVVDKIYEGGFNRSVDNMEYLLAIIGGKLGSATVH